MKTRIKICGISSKEKAATAILMGVDALNFIREILRWRQSAGWYRLHDWVISREIREAINKA